MRDPRVQAQSSSILIPYWATGLVVYSPSQSSLKLKTRFCLMRGIIAAIARRTFRYQSAEWSSQNYRLSNYCDRPRGVQVKDLSPRRAGNFLQGSLGLDLFQLMVVSIQCRSFLFVSFEPGGARACWYL